jgi:thymidylate kinase
MAKKKPAFICIIGVDGVGKTAHADMLRDKLIDEGIKCKSTWFRFYHFLSIFLLIYCKIVGLTVYETKNGQRIGRHDFYKSRVISALYPFILFIDLIPMYIGKIFLPRRLGYTIICDRFVYDTLVDLMVDLNDSKVHKKDFATLYLRLAPKNAIVIHLDLDENLIRKRREDLKADSTLKLRRKLYFKMCKDLGIKTIENKKPIDEVQNEIANYIKGRQNEKQKLSNKVVGIY